MFSNGICSFFDGLVGLAEADSDTNTLEFGEEDKT